MPIPVASPSPSPATEVGPVSSATQCLRWKESLRNAIRDPLELCRRLSLPESLVSKQAASEFRTLVTLEFLRRIQPGCPDDPLLRQVLPVAEETESVEGFTPDPLEEANFTAKPGLLHKYAGRVLMVTTGACAIHCRYCFRRHFPYESAPPHPKVWDQALDYLRSDTSIHEVLLSGGDPLTLVDEQLEGLIEKLNKISHLQRLRIHTRLPILIPSRIHDDFPQLLRRFRGTVVLVLHSNHVAEWDEEVQQACAALVDSGIPLLNQAVLMAGVNDNIAALEDLMLHLVNHRVFPYYLHQMDPVQGTHHFAVSEEKGKQIVDQLRTRLPGYAMPQYVVERAGGSSKDPIV